MRGLWLLVALAVIAGSLLPGNSAVMAGVSLLHVNDKVQHFLAYAVLACLPALTESRMAAMATGVKLVALGILLEVAQDFVPGRSCELLDAAADAAGVLCGLAAGTCVWRAEDRDLSS